MSVSSTSSNGSLMQNIQIDTMKKAQDVQAQQVLKVLQSAQEQQIQQVRQQQVVSQQTGIGGSLNILA